MKHISNIFSAAVLVASLAVAGPVDHGHARSRTIPKKTVDPSKVSIGIELVLTGLERPVAVRAAGDGSGLLFIIESAAQILG